MRRLTALTGPGWPRGRDPHFWPGREPTYVPLEVLDRRSPTALTRYPALPPPAADEEVTVVADDGRTWSGAAAWVALLWATRRYRAFALAHARADAWRDAQRFGRGLVVHRGEPGPGAARPLVLAVGARVLASVPWLVATVACLAGGNTVGAVVLASLLVGLLLVGDLAYFTSSLLVALALASSDGPTSALALGTLGAAVAAVGLRVANGGQRPDAHGRPRSGPA